MTATNALANTAGFSNRITSRRTKKALPFVVVLLNADTGIEQELGRFAYAGDAHTAGAAIAARPFPPGDWVVIARNA